MSNVDLIRSVHKIYSRSDVIDRAVIPRSARPGLVSLATLAMQIRTNTLCLKKLWNVSDDLPMHQQQIFEELNDDRDLDTMLRLLLAELSNCNSSEDIVRLMDRHLKLIYTLEDYLIRLTREPT